MQSVLSYLSRSCFFLILPLVRRPVLFYSASDSPYSSAGRATDL